MRSSRAGLSRGARCALVLAGGASRARRRRIRDRPALPAPAGAEPPGSRVDDRLARSRAGPSTTATTGSSDLPRLPRVLLRPGAPGAALDEADRGRRRLGARHHAGDAGHDPRRAGRRGPGGGRGALPRGALPRRRGPRQRGRDACRPSAARAWPSSRAAGSSSSRARATGARARPRRGQPAAARRSRSRAGAGMPAPAGRAASQPRRALVVSSPIGLGHAWRDVAIADELRRRVPGLAIEWLAQEPVTSLLARAARRSTRRAPSSPPRPAHIDARGRRARPARVRGHAPDGRDPLRELHALPRRRARGRATTSGSATRRGRSTYFLHENPELKTAPFAWLTDFVGWLPMPAGGEREAALLRGLERRR